MKLHATLCAASRRASTAGRLSWYCCFCRLLLTDFALLYLCCCRADCSLVGYWWLVASLVGGFFALMCWLLRAESVLCAVLLLSAVWSGKQAKNLLIGLNVPLHCYCIMRRSERSDATRRDYCQLPAKQQHTSSSKAIAVVAAAAVNNFN